MRHHIDGLAKPDHAPKNEARGSEDIAGQKVQISSPDCPPEPDESKAFSTWQARFALLGYSLHLLADGSLLVSRWCLTRRVPDMRDLGAVYRQMGGSDA